MMRGALRSISMLALLSACGSQADTEDTKGNSTSTVAAKPITQLRVAVEGAATAECSSDGPNWTQPQRDYVKHVSARMEVPVLLCPVASKADAATALSENKVDLALLDPASIAPVQATVRPIMTGRTPADIGRVEIVLVTKANASIKGVAEASRARLAFSGGNATMLAGVKSTLESANFPASTIASSQTLADAPTGLAAIISGSADVLVLYAAEWVRLCRGEEKGDKPCEGLKEIWRGRPAAQLAWSVRRDIPKESWARLLGLHMAMPLEKPDVARWFVPFAAEIEPTEATALERPIS